MNEDHDVQSLTAPSRHVSGSRNLSTRLVGRVLLVDDDGESLDALARTLRSAGCDVEAVSDPAAVLERLEVFSPDVLIADVRLPGTDGFELLERVRARDPLLPTVLITGYGTVPDAVRAMQRGALHYLAKPIDRDELLAVVTRALALQRARRMGRVPRAAVGTLATFDAFLGETPAMRALKVAARAAAEATGPLWIEGELGSGRKHLARAIHAGSPLAGRPLVRLNCAGLEAAALRDAFGAGSGALLLEDVADLGAEAQATLATLLEASSAGQAPRIIALTCQDLDARVAAGEFDSALRGRLRANVLRVPPLRERVADVALLAEHAATRAASEVGKTPPRIEDAARVLLEGYEWPGNVRELETVVRNAVALADEQPISAAIVQPWLGTAPRTTAPRVPGARFDEIERHAILTTYESCGRNALHTAAVLGLSPRTVHYRLREYRGQVGRRKRERG